MCTSLKECKLRRAHTNKAASKGGSCLYKVRVQEGAHNDLTEGKRKEPQTMQGSRLRPKKNKVYITNIGTNLNNKTSLVSHCGSLIRDN